MSAISVWNWTFPFGLFMLFFFSSKIPVWARAAAVWQSSGWEDAGSWHNLCQSRFPGDKCSAGVNYHSFVRAVSAVRLSPSDGPARWLSPCVHGQHIQHGPFRLFRPLQPQKGHCEDLDCMATRQSSEMLHCLFWKFTCALCTVFRAAQGGAGRDLIQLELTRLDEAFPHRGWAEGSPTELSHFSWKQREPERRGVLRCDSVMLLRSYLYRKLLLQAN